jgi:hypothetical protein
MFGLATECGVTWTFGGRRRLSPDEVAGYLFRGVVSQRGSGNVFLRNGARLYLDVGSHPEYATPECDNVMDLVAHDKAGERILEGLLVDADLPLSSPRVAQLDLAYHDVHRGRGLYYLLQRAGFVERAARDLDIFEAKSVPPGGHPPI